MRLKQQNSCNRGGKKRKEVTKMQPPKKKGHPNVTHKKEVTEDV